MARILSISSQVVRGHVGNSGAVPALQRQGHEVWPLPTVVLSNHPGHPKVAGTRIAPETMLAMAQALADNGWLGEVDGVSTGYLPSASHVAAAVEIIAMVLAARPGALVLVDPVLGDDPKGLYIAEEAALAVRDTLLPLASVLTPNRFELAWLSGRLVTDTDSAISAAATLGVPTLIATSVPGQDGTLVNLLCTPGWHTLAAVPRLAKVPHGTGDLLAALFLGATLSGAPAEAALQTAVGAVRVAIEASAGADELRLAVILPA
jgi:pyridoxine kinase